MTTIETIRQEIERRKVQYYEREMKAWDDNGEYGDEDCYFYQGKRKACEGLLSFIDSLSEEPDKSLEEEVKRYLREKCSGDDEPTVSEIARHFAEWQKEQMLKDAVEGVVCILPGSVAYVDERDDNTLKQYIIDNFKAGDKVKIVIVKED